MRSSRGESNSLPLVEWNTNYFLKGGARTCRARPLSTHPCSPIHIAVGRSGRGGRKTNTQSGHHTRARPNSCFGANTSGRVLCTKENIQTFRQTSPDGTVFGPCGLTAPERPRFPTTLLWEPTRPSPCVSAASSRSRAKTTRAARRCSNCATTIRTFHERYDLRANKGYLGHRHIQGIREHGLRARGSVGASASPFALKMHALSPHLPQASKLRRGGSAHRGARSLGARG